MDWLFGAAIVSLSAVGAALGTFLKEYFGSRGRKEGEIDAVTRNLEEVLRQVRETTKTTEQIRAAVSGQREHDRELFRQYDMVLSEAVLDRALNHDLYEKYSSTRFTKALHSFTELARTEGGQFLSEPVQRALSDLAVKAAELSLFVGRHFFRQDPKTPPDDEGHFTIALYPDFRNQEWQPGKPDWNAKAEELDQLCEQTSELYRAYRRAAKQALAI